MYSWKQYQQAAEEIAAGLRALGIGKGDVVALNSETRLEFYIADLGIMANGSVAAAMYPSYPPEGPGPNARRCGRTRRVRRRPEDARDAAGARWSIGFCLPGRREGAMTLAELRENGRGEMAARSAVCSARLRAEVQPSDIAILYLTSGATGEPKMALVTHQAIVSNLDMGPSVLPHRAGGRHGGVSAFGAYRAARRDRTAAAALRHAGDVLREPDEAAAGYPQGAADDAAGSAAHVGAHLFHDLHGAAQAPGAARKAFYAALGLGLAAARYRREGKKVPGRIRVPLKLADRLMFRKVRGALRRADSRGGLRRRAA